MPGVVNMAWPISSAQLKLLARMLFARSTPARLLFFQSSIASLPLANLSFPVVASVDVLEHLPLEVRDAVVAEMFRVARTALIVAFPCGRRARQTDEDFQKSLVQVSSHSYPLAGN
jgi:Methyltransferase domain